MQTGLIVTFNGLEVPLLIYLKKRSNQRKFKANPNALPPCGFCRAYASLCAALIIDLLFVDWLAIIISSCFLP
jgi:hypothetical protein